MAKTPTSNNQTPDETPDVTPTEQLPFESEPVGASSAASGGATGLGSDDPAARPSVFRRHPVASGVTAGVVAVVLVSGLTAWGVGSAVTASLTSSNSAAAPLSTATPAVGGSKAGAKTGRIAFRATIESMSGAQWTIKTRKGMTVTVDVTGSTQFGTKKTAETAGSFADGDSVIIVAARDADGTPTATRVVNAADVKGGGESGAGVDSTPMPTTTPTSTPDA